MILEFQSALTQFYNMFGVPAYRNVAIDTAGFPFVIYNVGIPTFAEKTTQGFTVYSSDASFMELIAVAEKIEELLPVTIETENGFVQIYKGDPFIQDTSDDDIYSFFVNIEIMNNIRS